MTGNNIYVRMMIYHFLADVFLKTPARYLTGYLGDLRPEAPELQAAIAPLVADLEEMETYGLNEWEDLSEDHERLFDSPHADLVPLWESVYVGTEHALMDKTTLDVELCYEQWGLEYHHGYQAPCDHFGLEMRFMALMNAGLVDRIGNAEVLFRGQSRFLMDHPARYVGRLSERIAEYATHPFHLHLADFIKIFIDRELEALGSFMSEAEGRLYLPASHEFVPAARSLGDEELEEIHVAGLNNCGGACSLNAHVQRGKVLRITSNDALSDAAIRACARGRGYRMSFLNPERLKYPMVRVGTRGEGKFRRISWEEAVERIASEMDRIGKTYGPASRYVNYSTGVSAVFRGDAFAKRLLSLTGGYLNAHNSYSTACINATTPFTFGTPYAGHSPDDFINAKLIILWGHNPAVTQFGPETMPALLRAKERGAKIIVVDPRYTETAMAIADEWIGLKPTTDSAMIDAMAHTIFSEGLQDEQFMDAFCLGFDPEHMPEGMEREESYREYVMGTRDGVPKTAEWASEITGVPSGAIVALAREYATTKPAALVQGFGPQRNANGEQIVRSINMITCLTGNVGIPGGSAGGGYYEQHALPGIVPSVKNPVSISIPCFLWTDAIIRGEAMTARADGVKGAERLHAGIKMIFNLGGNTLVNQHSDINRTARILEDPEKVEFIVCSDLFMTPSARFADILLPGISMFEGENMRKPWGKDGRYLLYSGQAIPPLFESRFEYDWLGEVAERLGVREAFTQGRSTIRSWLEASYARLRGQETELPDFDVFRKRGGHIYRSNPPVIAFRKQIEDPHHYPFPTPSGKIEIFSGQLHELGDPDQIPAIPKYVPAFEGPADERRAAYPYQLVGWHSKRRTHSMHENNPWMDEVEERAVWINTEDAADLGIESGDQVELFNDRGTVRIAARVTPRIVRGVLGLSQGAWYTPDRKGTDLRGSINVLSTSKPTPLVKGNPQHSNLVAIRCLRKER